MIHTLFCFSCFCFFLWIDLIVVYVVYGRVVVSPLNIIHETLRYNIFKWKNRIHLKSLCNGGRHECTCWRNLKVFVYVNLTWEMLVLRLAESSRFLFSTVRRVNFAECASDDMLILHILRSNWHLRSVTFTHVLWICLHTFYRCPRRYLYVILQ
jgi:hypothetical protein